MQEHDLSSDRPQKTEEKASPSFLQIVMSTLAAAFGVQTNKNRERDFNGGNIVTYIAAGLIFTVGFIVGVALLVKTILASAT